MALGKSQFKSIYLPHYAWAAKKKKKSRKQLDMQKVLPAFLWSSGAWQPRYNVIGLYQLYWLYHVGLAASVLNSLQCYISWDYCQLICFSFEQIFFFAV